MKEKIKNILFIMALGSVSTSALIGIKGYTLPIIERYEKFMVRSTILDAAGVTYKEEEVDNLFNTMIERNEANGFVYYRSPGGLYIFEFLGRGLWGMIKGVITLDEDRQTIDNVRIIAQEETPGLGARITEQPFLDSFKGKRFEPSLVMVLRTDNPGVREIDAITGATMTSSALIQMMNDSMDSFTKNVQ